MSRRLRCLFFFSALLAFACSGPNLREYEPRTGLIRGTVFYPGGTQRGNAVVLLFRAEDPPPPQGSGRPINFVVVPKRDLFGDAPAGESRDFTADFTIPNVPDGSYQIRAFLDADEDFNPIYDLLAQPTAGDVGGGYVDTTTSQLITFDVVSDQVTGSALVVLGQQIPVERPAFAITSSAAFQVPLAAPAMLSIEAHPINREQVRMTPELTRFLVRFADDDGDGRPDDVNGDHLPDVYPRVLLRKVATPEDARTIIVPLIINPLPYRDVLATAGATLTARLDLIVPPVAVEIVEGQRTILPEIPAGSYETVVISATGQTWQVPNDLDRVQPGATDPTQSVLVRMIGGAPLPAGTVSGTLRVATEREADGYVILFRAEDPPPPDGTGRPVGLASIPRAAFSPSSGGREAPFTVRGVPPGNYLVRGLYDTDGDFSPLIALLAQPSAGDFVGGAAEPVQAGAAGVTVVLGTELPFERPTFAIEGGIVRLERRPAGQTITLVSRAIAALELNPDRVRFPVVMGAGDLDGDNLRDLLPRVILTRMVDGVDPTIAPDDPRRIVIPGVIDPMAYVPALSMGVPVVPADRLRVILPPIAAQLGAGGARTLIAPIPPGRYRVNVLSPFGQTWSVPNDLDRVFGRTGTPRADATQAGYVEILDTPVPAGAISGQVQLGVAPPAGEFQVVVLAFAKNNPPPPEGSGRPVASAIVRKEEFAGGMTAPYLLRGLPSGVYQVRAFLDSNDDFVPWFDTHNQPDAGDVGGGFLNGLALGDVTVDALAEPVENVTVTIAEPLTFALDRPVFTLFGGDVVFDRSRGPVQVRLVAERAASSLLDADGVFPVQWIDLDRNGTADDVNADGNPDVYPLVVAELLDPSDPSRLTPAANRVLIFGFVNPAQFVAAGFPAGDPTATSTVVQVRQLDVVFPPVGVNPQTGPIGLPPAGVYRISVITGRGQTWTIPNELSRAEGDAIGPGQSRALIVQ